MADAPANVPKASEEFVVVEGSSSRQPAGSDKRQEESAGMSILSNTLAGLGFIILTIIILWGIVHLVQLSGFSFVSVFSSQPKIEVQAPSNAVSGQPLTVSWGNSSTAGGAYSFLYACESGFAFATQGQGGTLNAIPCGSAISVGSSTSATMIPELSGTSTVSVPFSVVFAPVAAGSAKETGSATIVVASAGETQPAQTTQTQTTAPVTKTTAPKTTSYAPQPAGNYSPVAHASSGPADLSVTIIASGYIDPSSGALLTNRAPQPGDVVGVEFDIANIGGSASGAYYFQTHLPTASAFTYTSPTQKSLAPGSHIVNTLRFTDLAQGGGIFTAIVNSNSEVSNANDEAAVTIY